MRLPVYDVEQYIPRGIVEVEYPLPMHIRRETCEPAYNILVTRQRMVPEFIEITFERGLKSDKITLGKQRAATKNVCDRGGGEYAQPLQMECVVVSAPGFGRTQTGVDEFVDKPRCVIPLHVYLQSVGQCYHTYLIAGIIDDFALRFEILGQCLYPRAQVLIFRRNNYSHRALLIRDTTYAGSMSRQ